MLNTNDKNTEVDFHLNSFLQKYSHNIYSLGVKAYKSTSDVALAAYKEQITSNLLSACNKFLSNPDNKISEINGYLYGSLKNVNRNILNQDKKTVPICPGCKYFNQIEFVVETSDGLSCEACNHSIYNSQNESLKDFYNLFANYSRQGYRCKECSRFVPKNICKDKEFKCPYPSCGEPNTTGDAQKISNPILKINSATGKVSLLKSSYQCTDEIPAFIIEDEIKEYIHIINDCIDEQIKTLEYKCLPSTYIIKLSMYNAFRKALQDNPDDLVPYLADLGRVSKSGKLQSKIFQVFIKELEANLPFTFTRRSETVEIKSLLDPNLCIFDGESVFDATINEERKIPNLTKEIYTGGRTGYYKLPFYIGKLLDIKNIETGVSLMDKVDNYSCVNIIMLPGVEPGTNVEVKHLRIPAHYYTGGFTYLNRIKKSISTRVVAKMKKDAA